jgi:hypothetical protein
VRVADLLLLLAVAVIVTERLADTGAVLITNVGETVAPAATVTEAGSVTLGSLLESVTTMPPAGAGPVSDTVLVPVIAEPPSTVEGERLTAETKTLGGGVTVRVAVALTPLQVAVIVTPVFTVTDLVLMVKVGETVAPGATVTDCGTVAAALLLDSLTTAPPAGAGPLMVTVLFAVGLPPKTALGERVTAETPGGIRVRVASAVTPL